MTTKTQGQGAASAAGTVEVGGARPETLRGRLAALPLEQLRALSLVGVLLVIWIIFQILTDGLFLSPRNLTTLTVQVAVTAILAAGIVMIMAQGYIDLSIGSAVAFTGMVATLVVDPTRGVGWTEDPVAIIALTLLSGLVIGAWQGFWVAWMRVPAFITTLASLLALRGAALTVTGGSTASHHGTLSFLAADFVPAHWAALALAVLVALFAVVKYFDWRARVAASQRVGFLSSVGFPVAVLATFAVGASVIGFSYRGAPLPVVILGAVIVLVTFIMSRMSFGRRIYAIGGNPAAARYAGVNIEWHCFFVFAFMGVLYGIAGLILVSRIGVAVPTAGTGLELTVIAAAVIGGTSLFGGTGTAIGAVIGALLLESLNNGMGLMNVESSFQLIVNGLVLLVAVYFDIRGRRRL
jgi:ABC-type xylose transport system permease subunit